MHLLCFLPWTHTPPPWVPACRSGGLASGPCHLWRAGWRERGRQREETKPSNDKTHTRREGGREGERKGGKQDISFIRVGEEQMFFSLWWQESLSPSVIFSFTVVDKIKQKWPNRPDTLQSSKSGCRYSVGILKLTSTFTCTLIVLYQNSFCYSLTKKCDCRDFVVTVTPYSNKHWKLPVTVIFTQSSPHWKQKCSMKDYNHNNCNIFNISYAAPIQKFEVSTKINTFIQQKYITGKLINLL